MAVTCRIYAYAKIKEYEWVDAQAQKSGLSLSQYIRAMILEKYMERDKKWDAEQILHKAKQLEAPKKTRLRKAKR